MKQFTENDVDKGGQFPTIIADRPELLHAPLHWQKRGLQQTASGYGAKLSTGLKIHFCGKLYRIYCTCYSNNGSCWFTAKGRKIFVD